MLLVCLCALATHAQQNDNTAPKAPGKSIVGMSSSDAPGGSKVTIASDAALNDYSAYRSGDRFYVVIPQANAKGVGGVRGRGFEGAQVQRRGQDVVLSFKLQPGASAHVDQRFNRLVVQFSAPEVGAPQTNTNQASAQPTPRTPPELSGVATPAPTVRPTPGVKPSPAVGVLPPGVVPTPLVTPSAIASSTPTLAVPSPTVSPTATPAATPVQIAQLQTTPAAPVAIATNASAPATSVSIGTTVLRNWPWLLLALFALGGLLLFVFARGGERRASLSPADEVVALKETPKPALPAKEPIKPVTPATPVATVPPVVPVPTATTPTPAPPVVAPAETRKGKKGKKGKKGRRAGQPAPVVAAKLTLTEAPQPQETATPSVPEVEAPIEAGATTAATAALLAATGAAALATADAQLSTTSDRAAEETRKLLAGEDYDEALIGSPDAGTRQLVAAELMTALATESEETHGARARTAFLKHGYFDDATRDLRTAEEPKQRASAARTLGLVGDKAATPHLVAALEDPAPEVRRAAVEALTELQDPTATKALEALRWRETSAQVPRKLIQQAIEASAVAEVLAPVSEPPAAPTFAPAAEPEQLEPAITEESVEPAYIETAPPTAVEPAPPTETELVSDEEMTQEIARIILPAADSTIEAPSVAPTPAPEVLPDVAPTIESAAAVETEAEPEPVSEATAEPTQISAAADASVEPSREPVLAESLLAASAVAPPEVIEQTELAELTAPSVEAAAPVSAEEPSAADTSVAPELSAATPVVPEASEIWRELRADFTEPAITDVGEVEPPVAEAEPETKAITEFVFTPSAPPADDWIDVDVEEHKPTSAATTVVTPTTEQRVSFDAQVEEHAPDAWSDTAEAGLEPPAAPAQATAEQKQIDLPGAEEERLSIIPKAIQLRLESEDVSERAASVLALARLNTDEAFHQICAAFDDSAPEVRDAAARALYTLADDRADSFTRALREAPPERRRRIGTAISASGLADEAVSNLTGESRDKTYDAFSLLFLMAKAGETGPLIHAIETHPENEVRLAVVKLLALSGQHEILPSFRRLAVRGSLPTEVRSAVMEAIYQISSQPQHTT
ncbi:MAG: HEAT repeat domain-containing protein [Pyrinomonadaceae bacterium]